MKFKFLYLIDKYVGNLLLFLIKILVPATSSNSHAQRGRAIIKIGEIGALAILFKDCQIKADDSFIVLEEQVEFLKSQGIHDDRIFFCNKKSMGSMASSILKMISEIRSKQFYEVVNLDPVVNFSKIISALIKAPIKKSLKLDLANTKHISSYYLNFFEHTAPYKTDTKRENIILINANPNDEITLRRWPMESFRQVIENILKLTNAQIYLIGLPKDHHDLNHLIVDESRVTNLAGQTTFDQLYDYIAKARCLISTDSGPAHIAALLQTPTITIYGPETPAYFGVKSKHAINLYKNIECSPCFIPSSGCISSCRDNRCTKLITPNEVIAAFNEVTSI